MGGWGQRGAGTTVVAQSVLDPPNPAFLNQHPLSFLSTSNEAIYKVFDDDETCTLVGKTCNPEVGGPGMVGNLGSQSTTIRHHAGRESLYPNSTDLAATPPPPRPSPWLLEWPLLA